MLVFHSLIVAVLVIFTCCTISNTVMLKDFLRNNDKKHLIFDLDETITHLLINWNGYRDGFYHRVAQFDSELIKEVPNKPGSANDLYNAVIAKHGFAGKKVVDTWCLDWEQKKYDGHEPNEQLVEFINTSTHRMFIWTANNHATAVKALTDLGILGKFTRVIAKEDANLSKPHPDGFYTVFNSQKENRDDYLMIGNSEHDHLAAIAAGIDFLWVQDCF